MKNIYLLLSTNKFRLKEEKVFKQYYPQLYKEILQIDFPTEFKFSQKLYHYFNNDYNLSFGLCSCGNRCRFISFNKVSFLIATNFLLGGIGAGVFGSIISLKKYLKS